MVRKLSNMRNGWFPVSVQEMVAHLKIDSSLCHDGCTAPDNLSLAFISFPVYDENNVQGTEVSPGLFFSPRAEGLSAEGSGVRAEVIF